MLYQSGRFAEAVTVLQQAVRIYQREGDNLAQAAALTNLSLAFEQIGSWKEALKAIINTSLNLLGWDSLPEGVRSASEARTLHFVEPALEPFASLEGKLREGFSMTNFFCVSPILIAIFS